MMIQKMEKFLSCDWGTSSFRLRLVEAETLRTIAEESSKEGIAGTFEQWKQAGSDERKRLDFYLDVIRRPIEALQDKLKISLSGIPLIISGMASSAIGMIDLPYADLPCAIDGSDLVLKTIEATENFYHPVHIISGVKTSEDVMRGEETQLIGCFSTADHYHPEEQLFIFPGTHSKHVMVRKNRIAGFKTYLTGELFNLLSEKSILSASVEKDEGLPNKIKLKSFEKGLTESLTKNVLHHAFLVRTNALFNKYTRPENYYYLSGLLIGNELKELADRKSSALTLVSNTVLAPYYTSALRVLHIPLSRLMDIDEALIKGQFRIYSLL